jgi:hypothetical protein
MQDFIFGAMCGFVFAMIMVVMVAHKPGATMYEWCEEIQLEKK